MRKRINLVFILLMGIVLVLTMVACNQKTPGTLPENIGGDPGKSPETLTPGLMFEFPVEMSSVFNSISLDKFVLEKYVTYSVVYTNASGDIRRVVKGEGVKVDWVDEDCKQYLSKPGHHDIKVSIPVGANETIVHGGFKLHLRDNSGAISLVKYTFNLRDTNGGGIAYPYFANNIDTVKGLATKNLEAGVVIESWSEFINTFKMSLAGRALQSVTADGVTYDSSDRGFPLVIDKDLTFNLAWTKDIINVKYDLNVPSDAVKISTAADPNELFESGIYANVTAQRRVGRIIQPGDEEINVYNGYYFGGWFNKADGRLWRFSSAVGEEDIELVAKWVLADYTFTIYPMGGRFAGNIQASTADDGTVITKNNASKLNYTLIECSTRFTQSDGSLNRITFTGFHYGVSYDRYVAEVTINTDGDKVLLKFSDFYRPAKPQQTILEKGDGDYVVIDNLYSDYQCTVPIDRSNSNVNAEQPVTYIKWKFHEPDTDTDDADYANLYDSRMSKYYTELVFKNGYDVLADGSIRLSQVADWTVNELIIPEYLKFGDIKRPITEIGERAMSGMKALTSIDMSKASSLISFGKEAFAYNNALSTIVMPENNSISFIGDNAFRGTDFENNYYKNNHGAEFIVIGKMIYKYVGEDKTEIDLSNPSEYYSQASHPLMSAAEIARFNRELGGVTSIEDGAFALSPSLATLSISADFTAIKDDALSGLQYFKTLNLPLEGSRLLNIGDKAFDGTLFLSERGNLYDGNIGAIIIGNVYYRLINKSKTEARIPSSRNSYAITHIAPRAFLGCTEIADIVFDDESIIVEIGKEAFIDTKYVKLAKQDDNFTAFNGILTHYYGPTVDANATNLIVPERVSTIGTYAFGKQAAYFYTLQINSNVNRIENYAFAGANWLKSIIFPQVSVSGNVLVNAPTISEYAFAVESDEMREETILYFSRAVITLLEKLANGEASTSDATTQDWVNLYKLSKNHFKFEDISSIVIDRNIISANLLKTGKTASAFTDTYGTTPIQNALIITANTGVARRTDLSWGGNNMALEEITGDPSSKYYSLWQNNPAWQTDGVKRYVVTYKYNGSTTGCPIEANDTRLFIVTIRNDIKDNPTFYSSANYPQNGQRIDANQLAKNGNMWFEGLDSQVAGREIPTFYTSNPGLSVRFAYKDINDNLQFITPTRIDNLRVNAETSRTYATIYVNFYGLGTYVFDYVYAVERSKFEAIEQTMPIAIPVNANAADYMSRYSVNLIGQDGNKERFAITRSNFNIIKVDGRETSVLNTSTLGMHSVTIEYTRSDAANRLEFNVYYTVILEADEELFEYDILNQSHKTAVITKCKAATDISTIVLPSRCEINGETYTVTQLGRLQGDYRGVFEGFANLSAVYLSETIENIGVNTFRNCRRLKNVYTALQAVSSPVEIPADDSHFAVAGAKYKETVDGVEWTVTPVRLLSVDGVEIDESKELIINNDYIVNEETHEKYRIVAVKSGLVINAKYNQIDVYLPDTIFSAVNIVDEDGERITPIFYYSGNNFMIKTANRAPELLFFIGVGAFSGCSNLSSIDLSKSVNLSHIDTMAFASSGLVSIDLSKNVALVDINNQVFENCALLRTVKLHGDIQHIGANAFSGDVLLTSVEGLTNNLKNIDTLAFNRCRSLLSMDIYQGLVTVGTDAFSGCDALTIYCHFGKSQVPTKWNATWNNLCPVVYNCDTNNVADDDLIYITVDGVRYALNTNTNNATVVGQAYALSGEIVIPATVSYLSQNYTVTTIKASAFEGNDRIISVKVTSSLLSIEANAFSGCVSLVTFDFVGDNMLENIASTAFDNCTSLTKIPQIESHIEVE